MRRELDRIHIGTFTSPAGTFHQAAELAQPARNIPARLTMRPPRKICQLSTPET